MAMGYRGLNEAWNFQRTSTWGVLGSVIFHTLIIGTVILAFHERPSKPRVVVPIEAVTLVPFKTGPKGGGGGRPAPVSKPEAVAEKPALPPKAKPKVKHQRHKAKLAPQPEPTPAPVVPTSAPAPAIGKAKTTGTAVASSRIGATGVSGSGQGGQGGGRGTGSGGGVGPGQGHGSGSGSVLQGYLREVRRLLEKHKTYPWMARRQHREGVVVLKFTIGRDGEIAHRQIARSSGHEVLDDAAQETLLKVGRFPPLPPALGRSHLNIQVPLAFRLNES